MIMTYLRHDLFGAGYQDLSTFSIAPHLRFIDDVMPLEIPATLDLEALEGAAIRLELDVQNNLQTLVGSST